MIPIREILHILSFIQMIDLWLQISSFIYFNSFLSSLFLAQCNACAEALRCSSGSGRKSGSDRYLLKPAATCSSETTATTIFSSLKGRRVCRCLWMCSNCLGTFLQLMEGPDVEIYLIAFIIQQKTTIKRQHPRCHRNLSFSLIAIGITYQYSPANENSNRPLRNPDDGIKL